MYALLSILPITLAICLMVFAKQKSSIAILCSWILAFIFATTIWQMNFFHALTWTLFGFLQSIPILVIIFGAIFMLNVLTKLEFIKAIGNSFNGLTTDRRVQIIIIAWFFGSFIEGAAGFGAPQAVAAPLMVGLGISPFFAALAALIGNAGPALFGAAGTPTAGGFATIETLIDSYYETGILTENAGEIFWQLNNSVAFTNLFAIIFVPFLMVASITARDGRKRGIKDALAVLPLCIFAGVIFAVPMWLFSFLGPQLPTLAGAIIGLPVMIFITKKKILMPKEIYRFIDDPVETYDKEKTEISTIMAWSPYVLVALILVVTRLPFLPQIEQVLRFHNNSQININNLLGVVNNSGNTINWNWQFLWNPSILAFLPVTVFFLLFAKNTKQREVSKFKTLVELVKKTLFQIKHATIALMFGVAMVQLMVNTNWTNPNLEIGSMTTEIAIALSTLLGPFYLVISPFIGVLGSFVSGSHTVSNVMFYGLQMQTAMQLGLPLVTTLVAQTTGGTLGNLIAINNIVAASATTGYKGSETKLIAATIVPMLIYIFIVVSILYISLFLR